MIPFLLISAFFFALLGLAGMVLGVLNNNLGVTVFGTLGFVLCSTAACRVMRNDK